MSGLFALALQAQGATVPSGTAPEGELDLVRLVLDGSPAGAVVLIILLLFSAAAWAIIVMKSRQFSRAERQSAQFLDIFRRSSKFSEVQAVCASLPHAPLVGLFQAAYAELNAQLRGTAATAERPQTGAARPTLRSLEGIDRSLLRATSGELAKLEHRVPFLATVASITPYIGLFGTVWGIMAAFTKIASAGSTSLGVVAPGIAEALIATAAGLFAAIPAVYFYNSLTNRVKHFAQSMDDFSLEFLNLAERNFT
ncbi:MAG: MotA/TolQ/ExbB proton channel family protein [Acidobacteriota bacterium]|nr:MotA/TolQ/ExbB proton channel family protein [Acidobacteriota bacterium]